MKPLVDHIISKNLSVNINGLDGTGKSTLIKMIQQEFINRGIHFETLAPSNKAARVIKGETIHKFIVSNRIKRY